MRKRLEDRRSVLSAGDCQADSQGDLVWHLQDGMIHICRVVEARTYQMGKEPDPKRDFTMYAIRRCVGRGLTSDYQKSIHRSELFLIPAEQDHLIEELEAAEDRLRRYREELEAREPGEVPDPERDDV